jgi:hypoxanthine-guanine phosphoribosyltransferase
MRQKIKPYSTLITISIIIIIVISTVLYFTPFAFTGDVITVISSLFAAISAISAWITVYLLVKDHHERNKPIIIIDFISEGEGIQAVIKNIGQSLAKNITFDFSPKPISYQLAKIFFDNPITYLTPGNQIKITFIRHRVGIMPKDYPVFDIKINYQEQGGKNLQEEYSVDLTQRADLLFSTQTVESSMKTLASEINKIGKSLEEIHKALEKRR